VQGIAAALIISAVLIGVGMLNWVNQPFPGFLVLKNGVVASAGLATWPAIQDGNLFQSRIVTYDGINFTSPTHLNKYIRSKGAGDSITYKFANQNSTFEREIQTRSFSPTDATLLFGVTLFSAIALLSVASALVYMAPRDPASIGCAMAMLIAGTFALTAVDLYGPYRFFRVHALAECFLGAGGIHMSLVFPHPRKLAIQNPWLIPAGYLTSCVIGITNQVLLFKPAGYTATHLAAISWAGVAFAIMAASQVAAYLRPTSYESRKRVTILALGTFLSIIPAVGVAIGSSVTGGEAPENLISWTGAFFPISVGYAVLKSDLLEVDSVIRRTVNYALLSVAVAAIYTAFISVTDWLLRDPTQSSRTASTLLFSLLLTIAILPIRDRLQSWVDRTFFRANYDFRHTIEDASNELARMIDLNRIRDRIIATVRSTLNPEEIHFSILVDEIPLELNQQVRIEGRPKAHPERAPDQISVAFRSRDRVVARLDLGRKLSGHFYSGLDRALLNVLANQGAIAIENALAVEKLQDLNRTLERRVSDRTAELASALDDLTSTQAQLLQAERLAAVGELAAGVAHEINNPLNFARNSLRTLKSLVDELIASASTTSHPGSTPALSRSKITRGTSPIRDSEIHSLTDDITQLVEILGSGLDRTARLVQDLRDFASPKRAEPGEFLVSKLIIDAINLIGPTFRERAIDVRHHADPQEQPVIGDPNGISQVVLNILKNAIDAVEGTSAGFIETRVTMHSNKHMVVVEFIDNGPGIAGADPNRLFEPFYSTKPAGKGTGLGLALCLRIVQEHNGAISIESRQTGGALVTMLLPCAQARSN